MSTINTKMKPTEPTESTTLEKLHADLIADNKWTMPPQPTQEIQPQPLEASLPASPKTSENLPPEPFAEDDGMTPEESRPPLAPAEDVPEVDFPEPPVEETSVSSVAVEKKPRKFEKKSIGVVLVVSLLLLGGGLTFAIFGMPNEIESVATNETSTSPNPTDVSDEPEQKNNAPLEATPEAPAPTAPTTTPKTTTGGSSGSTPTSPTPAQSTARTYGISYTNNCYLPATITIKRGDSIVFSNNSTRDMWPASDNHPTHTAYSEFDSKQDIAPGGNYTFVFNKTGTWGFHDHSKPNCSGSITVQ